MKRTQRIILLCMIMTVLIVAPIGIALSGQAESPRSGIVDHNDMSHKLGAFDGVFVRNMGQWRDEIHYTAAVPYGHLASGADGIILNVRTFDREEGTLAGTVIKLTFSGGRPVVPEGDEEQDTHHNFFIGKDPSRWVSGAKGYRTITYRNVWDGIDIVYRFTEAGLKYDIIVAPGADPDDIRIEVEGASHLRSKGDSLLIGTGLGFYIEDSGLFVYQEGGKEISSSFRVEGSGYGFSLGTYDRSLPLVIDPNMNVVEFSTYVGGSGGETFFNMDYDDDLNLYICGQTDSWDFPNVVGRYQDFLNGWYDAFVFKLDDRGANLLWATYIGGNETDQASSVKVDPSGNVFLMGLTYSGDFPTTDGAYNETLYNNSADFFVLKLDNRATSLTYSTYVGGSQWESTGWGSTRLLDIDEDGNAYVAGSTSSSDFPVTDDAFQSELIDDMGWGGYDIVLFKLDSSGSSLLYSTYIGGYDYEEVCSIRYDGSGSVYMGGTTSSWDFPVTDRAYSNTMNGWSDAFILKLNIASSTMDFCTFFGGSYSETVYDIVLDDDGNVYACGQTYSSDLPVTDGAYNPYHNGEDDGFVMALDPTGSNLVFSTYVGGEAWDGFNSIYRDLSGDLHVVGVSYSELFPAVPGSFQDVKDMETDGVYVKLSGDGSDLLYSTFIGGSSWEQAGGIVVDEDSGRPIITGDTSSSDFPTKEGGYDTSLGGWSDIFAIKLDLALPPSAPMDPSATAGDRFVEISWVEPLLDGGAPVTDYMIYKGTSEFDLLVLTNTGGALSYNDTDVINGVMYYYFIRAVNFVGEGLPSEIVSALPASIPSAPENFTLNFGNGYVNISWTIPNNWGGLILMNYNLYKTEVGTGAEDVIEISVGKWYYRDVEVKNGETYTYHMTALNPVGESHRTRILTASPGTIPMEPEGIRTRSGPGFVMVGWEAPDGDGGSPLLRYMLHRSVSGGLYNRLAILDPDVYEYNDTHVINGVTYSYAVTAVNAWGESPMTYFAEATPMSRPSEPLDAEAIPSDRSITVRWAAPLTDGGSTITGYIVYRYLRDDIWEKLTTTAPNVKKYVDAALVNGRNYRYHVTARNALGESDPSPEFNATPLGTPVSPTGIASTGGDGSIRVRWNPVTETGSSPITEYWILRGQTSLTLTVIASVMGNVSEYIDTAVENGIGYFHAVRAVNAFGPSPPSEMVYSMPKGLPDHPDPITVRALDRSIEIWWGQPARNGGSSITHLTLYRGTSPDELSPITVITGSPEVYVDAQLTNGITYYYSMSSSNAIGEGPLSEPVEAMPSGKPSAPSNLQATSGSEGILLAWQAPSDNGGISLIGYWVYRIDPSGTSTPLALVSADATEFLDVGARPGVSYTYRVTAANANGEGAPSASVSASIAQKGSSSLAWIVAGIALLFLLIALIAIAILLMTVRRSAPTPVGFSEPIMPDAPVEGGSVPEEVDEPPMLDKEPQPVMPDDMQDVTANGS